MKKNPLPLKLLCLMALVAIASTLTLSAADFVVDDIYYNVISNNEVEVTSPDTLSYAGEIIIPETVMNNGTTYRVTRIGKNAFADDYELTLVNIPEGVTEIDRNGFSGCYKLENIDLPNSLVKIGERAFYGCRAFTTFYVPRNLAEIGYNTFTNCSNIEYFMCSSLNQHFRVTSGVLYNKEMTQLVWYPAASPTTTFTVPNTVTSLHDYCFSSSSNLVEVVLPESLTWMGRDIFRGCTGLTEIDIPDGVRHMGVTVFGDCSNLTRVHLPASLDSLMNCTFMSCYKLLEVTVPRNVFYIDEQAFMMSKLETITFEEGSQLQTIGPRAFYQCTTLKALDVPNSVRSIGSSSFYRCSSLKSIHIGDNLTEIGSSIFYNCDSLVVGEVLGAQLSMQNIFVNCPLLKKITLGSKDAAPGITFLANCAIAQNQQLEYLELGSSIDTLAHLALTDINNVKVLICWAEVPPRCDSYYSSFSPRPQDTNATLYVRKASLEAYKTARDWMNFKTIVAIEDLGDVDGDGFIQISDVTELIDQMLNGEVENPALADMDLDGSVTISDVTALIDQLLNNATN